MTCNELERAWAAASVTTVNVGTSKRRKSVWWVRAYGRWGFLHAEGRTFDQAAEEWVQHHLPACALAWGLARLAGRRRRALRPGQLARRA